MMATAPLTMWAAVSPDNKLIAAPFDTEQQVRDWAAMSIDEKYRPYRPVLFSAFTPSATSPSEDVMDARYWRHAVDTNMIRDAKDGVALVESEVQERLARETEATLEERALVGRLTQQPIRAWTDDDKAALVHLAFRMINRHSPFFCPSNRRMTTRA